MYIYIGDPAGNALPAARAVYSNRVKRDQPRAVSLLCMRTSAQLLTDRPKRAPSRCKRRHQHGAATHQLQPDRAKRRPIALYTYSCATTPSDFETTRHPDTHAHQPQHQRPTIAGALQHGRGGPFERHRRTTSKHISHQPQQQQQQQPTHARALQYQPHHSSSAARAGRTSRRHHRRTAQQQQQPIAAAAAAAAAVAAAAAALEHKQGGHLERHRRVPHHRATTTAQTATTPDARAPQQYRQTTTAVGLK